MIPDVLVGRGVVVPGAAMRFRAVRSAGPGGQNVNKVATRVELHVDTTGIVGLSGPARARLEALVGRHRDADGAWLVTSQRTRNQSQNLDDALAKVRLLVARAMVAPRPRRPTRPTQAARKRRLEAKRRRSQVKRQRGTPTDDS